MTEASSAAPDPRRPGSDPADPSYPMETTEPTATAVGKAETYRSRDVVQLLGISRRQLQYWAQTDLIVPSARTPGGHHRYTFEDLVALKTAKRLIDAGVSVQRIRSSLGALRELLPSVESPLAELVLVTTGDVVLVFHEGTAFEAVSGQEWVFEVAEFQREIDTWRKLRDHDPRRQARRVPSKQSRGAQSGRGLSRTA